jgi:glycosyltransferase involved in cell wall biosynthesis
MRVFINPSYTSPDRGDGGIRRVVEAQQRYLPSLGWDIASTPDEADLIANHGTSLVERPGVPMANHNHGLYWEDYAFGDWGDVANRHVIDVMTRAQAITAPSQWVAHAISRGMLISPEVVYHGVDADDWAHDETHGGYVLWNKARVDPVSDPSDMQRLADLLPDVPFVSTFGKATPNVTITGVGSYEQMRPLVQRAGVYLATARETFGIGTLEALAAGVPVVGWDYGGQREIIRQGETGYLVPFGDLAGLADAVQRCLVERDRLSANCRADAAGRWGWEDKIQRYADLYTRTVQAWRQPRPKVSVVITAYNLGHYLSDALKSVDKQTMSDWECVIVDDCSTDEETQRYTKIADLHDQMRYLRTPENLGLAGARNYGWQHAHGKYVLFLDADDQLAPNALDQLSAALDHDSSIHIAYGNLDIVNHDGQERKRNPWPDGDFHWQAQIAHLNQLPYCSMLRREVLERSGGYRTRDWRAEDASLWSRVTSFGFRAAHVTSDTTLIYRLHSAQKSRGEDSDGDWTAWLPWRIAGEPRSGFQAIRGGAQPNARLVPFGAQGEPPVTRKAWPVRHHQHPVVSVIIPVGPGHAEYLIDALDSVQAQTMPEWECLVIDDAWTLESRGGSAFINTPVLPVLNGHPWAQCIATGPNQRGTGAARNTGLAAATAPLVLFLDADDVLVPRALELLLKGYADSGGRYAYSDWLTLEDERRIDGPMERHEVEDYDARAMLTGLRHAVTALIPTDWARAVGGFDESLPVFEDWAFYCKLAASGYCGVRVAQPLLIYRRQSGLRTRMALRPRENGEDVPAYTPLGEAAAAAIIDRFTPWTSGQEAIMGCCGGSAPVVQAAHEALNDMLDFATGGTLSAASPVENGAIRMEFVGDQLGAQSYYGKGSKLLYRAGREMGSRFHDVDPRDVEYFLSLGLFRIVAPEPLMAAAVAEPEMAVLTEPRVQGRVKGRR